MSNLYYLIAGALIVIAGFVVGDNAITFGVIIGLLFAAFFYFTRKQVISLKSASSVINVQTTGMSIETALSFVDAVESAKSNRNK